MYADDTVLYTAATDKVLLQNRLSNDFQRITDWFEANELITNIKPGKTECMIFGTAQKTKNVNLNIGYRHHTISETSSFK